MIKQPARVLKALLFALLLTVQAVGTASQAPRRRPHRPSRRPSTRPAHAPVEAQWIVPPGTDPFGFGVYHFRKTLELAERPARFVVHVTADNRYQLWVNGERVVWGPARGDLNHWRFETVDLAPHLRAGRNILAAVVWNYGELAPESQVTWRTGFLLQGNTKAEQAANTNESWKAARNPAYAPIPFTHAQMRGYYVVGPGERVDGAKFPWGWETAGFSDEAWATAVPVVPDGRAGGSPRGSQDAPNRWLLVQRTIPLMEERPEADGVGATGCRRERAGGVPHRQDTAHGACWNKGPPAHRSGLPDDGLPGARVQRRRRRGGQDGYAEALYTPSTATSRPDKGDRNEVEGRNSSATMTHRG